jgi:hypothetical protein
LALRPVNDCVENLDALDRSAGAEKNHRVSGLNKGAVLRCAVTVSWIEFGGDGACLIHLRQSAIRCPSKSRGAPLCALNPRERRIGGVRRRFTPGAHTTNGGLSSVATSDEMQIKGGRRQSVFRLVNERIEEVLASDDGEILCECYREDCADVIPLTREEYEEVRRFSTRFLVKPGHVLSETERAVETNERYVVVEKSGEGGKNAVELDPRRRRRGDIDPRRTERATHAG